MVRRWATFALQFVVVSATADTVKLVGRPAFESVEVIAVSQGKLCFRGLSGEVIRRPVAAVEWIAVGSAGGLTNAERMRTDGDLPGAIAAYERFHADAVGWARDFARLRLLATYDDLGQAGRAYETFITLLEAGLVDAAAAPGSLRNARDALPVVERSAKSHQRLDIRQAVRPLWVELLLAADVPLPGDLKPPTTRPASKPADDVPLLFGESIATGVETSLPDRDALFRFADSRVDAGDAEGAVRMLERARPFVQPGRWVDWRMSRARALVSIDPALAASEFLAIAAEATDRGVQAQSLFQAALTHEAMGRADAAAAMYRELLRRDDLATELRTRVRARLPAK